MNFTKSDEYRKRIHSLIPGGAHTYSKGDDQFPELAPAAISHGKGAYVWDLDGNKFLDCSMGLTSVSLGHAYEPVINRVKAELDKGVNFQRPSYIEGEMAEAFLALVPCHDMIKFAKNGSTVTTAAVKLARVFTSRPLVAFPGDHSFYSYDDWFIGKTAADKGVPDKIKELTVTYDSRNLESLRELFARHPGQIACVISEPLRIAPMAPNYIEEAIQIAHHNGALFIQDEMITGFKYDFPGHIKNQKLKPDMACWGKGIANGFSFCCLTGKKEVMELGGIKNSGQEKVFLISTTHGGETSAIAAGLATIKVFQNNDVIGHNHALGKLAIENCNKIVAAQGLQDHVLVPTDYPWMASVAFTDKNKQPCHGMRTLAMQEMIKNGVLFQGILVPSFSHSPFQIELFCEAFKNTLVVYARALEDGFEKYLVGSPAQPVFRKYV